MISISRTSVFAWALAGLVMAVLSLSAIGKLLDLPEFQRSLDTWSLVPPSVRPAAALFIPSAELAISVAWLLNIRRPAMTVAAFILLIVFTLAYFVHWTWMDKPTCNCLGIISKYLGDKQTTGFFLARNGVLITALSISLWLSKSNRIKISPIGNLHPDQTPGGTSFSANGFTLIELILVIVIIGLLVTLLAPNLKIVKDRAERTASFARLAGHGRAFIAYTADYKDAWPFLTVPDATFTVLRGPGIDVAVQYWNIYSWWHVPMSQLIYQTSWTDKQFRERRQDLPGPTPYWYSPAFLADPSFFIAAARTGRSQWRATRVNEVLFPSRKALLVSSGYWMQDTSRDPRVPMAFSDGSADEISTSDSEGWDVNGTGWWTPGAGFTAPTPGMVTIGGVRGRDRR